MKIIDFKIVDNTLKINQYWHKDSPLNKKLGLYGKSYGCKISVNLDTFGRLCKEWCYTTHAIILMSYIHNKEGRAVILKPTIIDKVVKENTELEAIIKATEWVYKKNKTFVLPKS